MSELSSDAQNALERGFRLDGPSAERRERVKGRVLVAIGGGVTALGTVSSVAGAAGPAVAVGGLKSLLGTSLVVWFVTGVGAGLGVGGVAAVAQHVQVATPAAHLTATEVARAPEPAPAKAAEAPPAPPAAETTRRPVVEPPARDGHVAPPVAIAAREPRAAVEGTAPSAPDPTSMSEEASLLQSAQRALAAGRADAALGLLAEHELRFPSGALAEERRVAKILALCALGRVEEASILARAFVARSPRSVLIPRLETSCVGKALGR